MAGFIEKITEWILQKEEEAAKKCYIAPDDVDAQIKKVQEKKDELEAKCKEEINQLEDLINRLEKIKEESCKRDKGE